MIQILRVMLIFFRRNKYLDLSQNVNFFSLTTRYRNNLPLGTQYVVEDKTLLPSLKKLKKTVDI